jgi:hypothetical protein
MRLTALATALTCLLAAPIAAAQEYARTAVVPVFNQNTGQMQGLLLLEPQPGSMASLDRLLGGALTRNNDIIAPAPQARYNAALVLESDPSVGLVCDSRYGSLQSIGALSQHCSLARISAPAGAGQRVGLQARVERGRAQLSTGVDLVRIETGNALGGSLQGRVPLNLSLSAPGLRVDEQDLRADTRLSVGDEGWISIGGSVARARLIPADQLSASGLPQNWNSTRLRVGVGTGSVAGEIVGQQLEVPGQPGSYQTLGVGVSWNTPWRSRVTLGADNVVRRGTDPLRTGSQPDQEEGSVPYVRYEQDL